MLSRIDGAFLALDTEHGIYREHAANAERGEVLYRLGGSLS